MQSKAFACIGSWCCIERLTLCITGLWCAAGGYAEKGKRRQIKQLRCEPQMLNTFWFGLVSSQFKIRFIFFPVKDTFNTSASITHRMLQELVDMDHQNLKNSLPFTTCNTVCIFFLSMTYKSFSLFLMFSLTIYCKHKVCSMLNHVSILYFT